MFLLVNVVFTAETMALIDLLKNKNLLRSSGFINGKFVPSSTKSKKFFFDVCNPANGQSLIQLPRMGPTEALEAIHAANSAWVKWKKTSGHERSRVLSKMADLCIKNKNDLATIVTMESGKPFSEAIGEINYATSFYSLYADEAKRIEGKIIPSPFQNRRTMATKSSVGPAALITPWNFPAAMITRKVGPALAAGCTVVIKPSEETPLTALAFCAIAEEAGVPPGVINCLTVGRDEVVDVGKVLCNSPLIRKVSFTGSTPVGKWLMRESASTVKRVSLELGGNAPFIVFDDADLDVAVAALMSSKFRNAGQACIASNRVFVQDGVYDKFAQMLADKVSKTLKCGNGMDAGTSIGPLINQQGLAKVSRQAEDCLAKGATALTGGSIHEELNARGGTFFQPTVLTGVSSDMLPFQEETFGPLLPLMKFTTEEEVLAMANDSPFGLAGYACTQDLARAFRVSEELDCGMVGINEGGISADNTPFGGVKESGIGREGGTYGLEEYMETKYVCIGLGRS